MELLNRVFPTCVGVFLFELLLYIDLKSIPHMRGGVSHIFVNYNLSKWVFPTCVGVFPVFEMDLRGWTGIPHMRGGVSRQN